MTLRLYHRPRAELINEILKNGGFIDSRVLIASNAGVEERWGVALYNVPSDNLTAARGAVLEVLLDATEESLADWNQDELGERVFPPVRKGNREWLIPAAVLNPLVSEIRIVPKSTLEN